MGETLLALDDTERIRDNKEAPRLTANNSTVLSNSDRISGPIYTYALVAKYSDRRATMSVNQLGVTRECSSSETLLNEPECVEALRFAIREAHNGESNFSTTSPRDVRTCTPDVMRSTQGQQPHRFGAPMPPQHSAFAENAVGIPPPEGQPIMTETEFWALPEYWQVDSDPEYNTWYLGGGSSTPLQLRYAGLRPGFLPQLAENVVASCRGGKGL